jgi:hypothetical protein
VKAGTALPTTDMIWIVAMGTSCETWLYHTQQPGRFEINFLDSGHCFINHYQRGGP